MPQPQVNVSISGDRAGTSYWTAGAGDSEASPNLRLHACVFYGNLQWGSLRGRFFSLGVVVFLGVSSCVVGPCAAVVLGLRLCGSERAFVRLVPELLLDLL